jgi:hypothetical protein
MLDTGPPNGSSGTYQHGAQLPRTADVAVGKNIPPACSACTANPFALVAALAVELSFVLSVMVFARLSPGHAVDVAGSTTAISVAGFYSRNAIVTIGRRLIGTAEHENQ